MQVKVGSFPLGTSPRNGTMYSNPESGTSKEHYDNKFTKHLNKISRYMTNIQDNIEFFKKV